MQPIPDSCRTLAGLFQAKRWSPIPLALFRFYNPLCLLCFDLTIPCFALLRFSRIYVRFSAWQLNGLDFLLALLPQKCACSTRFWGVDAHRNVAVAFRVWPETFKILEDLTMHGGCMTLGGPHTALGQRNARNTMNCTVF